MHIKTIAETVANVTWRIVAQDAAKLEESVSLQDTLYEFELDRTTDPLESTKSLRNVIAKSYRDSNRTTNRGG